jgi:hypothetical protein
MNKEPFQNNTKLMLQAPLPSWVWSIVRLLRLSENETDFRMRLLNPAYCLNLFLMSALGLSVAVAMLILVSPKFGRFGKGSSSDSVALAAQPSRDDHRGSVKKADAIASMKPAISPDSANTEAVAVQPSRKTTSPAASLTTASLTEAKGEIAPETAAQSDSKVVVREISDATDTPDSAHVPTPDSTEAKSEPSTDEAQAERDLPKGAVSDGPIIASLTSRIYHSKDCPLRPAMKRHPVFFASAAAADAAGFAPCPRCQISGSSKSPSVEPVASHAHRHRSAKVAATRNRVSSAMTTAPHRNRNAEPPAPAFNPRRPMR